MTDRYYPKNLVPSYPADTTYNVGNQLETHPRSNFPPGYSGTEYLARQKFGYATPAPEPKPFAPIDGDDPLVNFGQGEYVVTESLKGQGIALEPKEKKEDQPEKFQTRPFLGDEFKTAGAAGGEDDAHLTFTCATSKYLSSQGKDAVVRVDKFIRYQPAVPGRGTGYNSDAGTLNNNGPKLDYTSTTKDSYPPPASISKPLGLTCLNYTKSLQAK